VPNGSKRLDDAAGGRAAGAASLVVPVIGIVVYVSIFTFRQLADPTELPTINDLDSYFFPTVTFLHRSLLAGELPLWNPHQLAGVPFLALHSPGATYLPLLVLSFLPPHMALVVHTISHLVLAGLFTALFVRRLGVGAGGCLIAAIAFVGSPELVGAVHNPAYLATFVWLPASFWVAELLIRRRNARLAAILAGCLYLGFTAGHAQAFVYTAQALGVYVTFRIAVSLRGADRTTSLALLALAGVLALGLVAVQLLPSMEHARYATRGMGGMSFEQATQFQFSARNSLGGVLSGRGAWPFGLPALITPLAFAAVVSAKRRLEAVFFVCLLLLTFDFAHGDESLVFKLYFQLPLGDVFRIPIRIGFVYHFCAAVVLGLGCEAVLARIGAQPHLARATAVLAVAFVAWDVYLRSPLELRFAPLSAPEALLGPQGIADFVDGYDRVFIEGHPRFRKLGTIHGIYVVPDYDPLLPARYKRFFGIPPGQIWHGELSVMKSAGGVARQPAELLDLLSVRFYYGHRPLPVGRSRLGTPTVPESDPPLLVRRQAVPRAYVVHEIIRVETESEALDLVRAGRFDPHRQVILHSDPGPVKPRLGESPEKTQIASYRATRVEVEATCWSSCLLVLTDLFDPNWRATLGGEPIEVVAANFLFRGVRLPAGDHRVVFEYRPDSFYRGAVISLAAAGVVLFLLVHPARRSARNRASTS
jgi:hypothetical protein